MSGNCKFRSPIVELTAGLEALRGGGKILEKGNEERGKGKERK